LREIVPTRRWFLSIARRAVFAASSREKWGDFLVAATRTWPTSWRYVSTTAVQRSRMSFAARPAGQHAAQIHRQRLRSFRRRATARAGRAQCRGETSPSRPALRPGSVGSGGALERCVAGIFPGICRDRHGARREFLSHAVRAWQGRWARWCLDRAVSHTIGTPPGRNATFARPSQTRRRSTRSV